MPSAMAPLDTMTTSRRPAASTAICRHQLPMAWRPRPALVGDQRLEPTLTTMRRASRAARRIFHAASSVPPYRSADPASGTTLRQRHVLVDGLHHQGWQPSRA